MGSRVTSRERPARRGGETRVLFRIVEAHCLQLGKNCTDENLRFNAK